MQLDRRLLACVCCAISLVTAQASAQPAPPPPPAEPAPPPPEAAPGSETLETPYSDVPPPPPASSPPVAPTPPSRMELRPPMPDKRPLGPIRARRKLALLGELGWNSLAGFGPVLTYHVHPHFSLDLGAGFSLLGPKVGLRGRYNFSTAPFTPFVGAGFNHGTGLGQITTDPSKDPNGDPNREPVTVDLKPSNLIQAVVGFDYIHRRGFTIVGCLGYAYLLNKDNYEVLAGSLTDDEEQGFDIAFKGGLVISLAMGYSFE